MIKWSDREFVYLRHRSNQLTTFGCSFCAIWWMGKKYSKTLHFLVLITSNNINQLQQSGPCIECRMLVFEWEGFRLESFRNYTSLSHTTTNRRIRVGLNPTRKGNNVGLRNRRVSKIAKTWHYSHLVLTGAFSVGFSHNWHETWFYFLKKSFSSQLLRGVLVIAVGWFSTTTTITTATTTPQDHNCSQQ